MALSLAVAFAFAAATPRAENSPTTSGTVPVSTCLGCHKEAGSIFMKSAHGRHALNCQQCHGPGAAHAKNPASVKMRAFKTSRDNKACLACHDKGNRTIVWSGAHRREGLVCTACHKIHEPAAAGVQQASDKVCRRCHMAVFTKGSLPYHHPVEEGKMSCLDCHNPHGGPAGNNLRATSVNTLCAKCHAQYEGPFTYQHPPVSESCLNCHDPHGSMNRSLLVVSQPMLCLQCHPGHHDGSGVPLMNACTSCHNSIHGSDVPSSTGGSLFMDKP
jgi:DmsE family decaheme c-type cytochrome